MFPVLTPTQAALFTAIVTAFVLEASPDLKNLSASNRPSSIWTISSLWFLSIMSSLAASTWAIICLEWCAYLTNVSKAEDYKEKAENRQRKFEAVQRWKMGLVVAAIPLFLHFSLLSFLAGLWLRLRVINKEIGFVVGIPGLVVASTYVMVALLPFFTEAPFFTSSSEFIHLVVRGIKCIAGRSCFIRPPILLAWVPTLCSRSYRALRIPRLWTTILTFVKSLYGKAASYIASAWQAIARLLPYIFPTYAPDQRPFDELSRLKCAPPDPNKQLCLRALLWYANTPLSRKEVMDVLEEFRYQCSADEEPLDRSVIELLVSTMSSLLKNREISEDEEPIFHHCTGILAEEIEKLIKCGGDLQGIQFWKFTPLLERLLPYFHLDDTSRAPPAPSSEDVIRSRSTAPEVEVYWLGKMIPAMFLCPLPETVKSVAGQFDKTERLTGETLLRIVHGLHVATLVCSESNPPIIRAMPDLGVWSWDSCSLDPELTGALLPFLKDLFTTLLTHPTTPVPITIPSLAVSCLKALEHHPDWNTSALHSALCLLVVVAYREDPQAFKGQPTLVHELLKSYKESAVGDELGHARRLVARLLAIACGPNPLSWGGLHLLAHLKTLSSPLSGTVVEDKQCLKGFLGAYVGTLEATHSMEDPTVNHQVVKENILTNHFFIHRVPLSHSDEDPNYRLPYLYSLAIALTHAKGWDEEFLKVSGENEFTKLAELLVNPGETGVTLERALDTNILVVAVLGFAASNQSETTRGKLGEIPVERFKGAIRDGTDWRTRWKSIYFIADLTSLLSKIGMLEVAKGFLIPAAKVAIEKVKSEPFPSDWGKKKERLELLAPEIKFLVPPPGQERGGVYEWIGEKGVPYGGTLISYHHLAVRVLTP